MDELSQIKSRGMSVQRKRQIKRTFDKCYKGNHMMTEIIRELTAIRKTSQVTSE